MKKKISILDHQTQPINREKIAPGQWVWVKDNDDEDWWFGCIMEIGSNYVTVESPREKHNGCSWIRIHFDNLEKCLRFESSPKTVIDGKVAYWQNRLSEHIEEVNRVTAKLGINPQPALDHPSGETDNSQSLVVMSSNIDIGAYEKALIKAKDQDLPDLFQSIKNDNEHLAKWMSAEMLPLMAQSRKLDGCLKSIDNRLFNVSLYAGLTEKVIQCADGETADFNERLRIMQRKLYMDEECILGYRHGGIDCQSIEEFDRWLTDPDNRDRILPFPRCVTALQVRRNKKYREWDGRLKSLFINIELGDLDKLTFLYLRNGERVYRLNCDLEFEEKLFPDQATFDPGEPMMMKDHGREFMSVREYETRVKEQKEAKANARQWEKEHPFKAWSRQMTEAWLSDPGNAEKIKRGVKCEFNKFAYERANPYLERKRMGDFYPQSWAPFDDTNVYYDDAIKNLKEEMDRYNRVVLIIQGLLDRSDVLHPHPRVRTWEPEDFNRFIKLVYDGSAVLNYGDPPDFEVYRARCNASLTAGCVTVGQEDYWERKEAEKECERMDRDWRDKGDYRPERFRPWNNPGPGYLARIKRFMPKARKATYEWTRERIRDHNWRGGAPEILTKITVPEAELFNVDAYTPGDYKQFYRDPRTRQHYLRWANMLIAAEEYHAGNLDLGTACE